MGKAHYVPALPKYMEGIELARGYFEGIAVVEGGFRVNGWMLVPDEDFDSISVYWNGELVGSADVELRQDVASVFPWIPHAGRSGFRFRLPKATAETPRFGRLDLLGCHGGRPSARLSSLFRADLETAVPTPPPELMERVAGNRNPMFFKIGGLQSFGEFVDAISRHCELRSVRRVLDWGCGCGRVIVHFLLEPNMPEVFGCDIDPEAIAWCSEHLRPGTFSRIEPWPPTPYKDETFDLVIAYSVFTHLARDVQKAWLAEMKRIIAPGGLFLASTHGDFAALFTFPKSSAESASPRGLVQKIKNIVARYRWWTGIPREGIYDRMPDLALKGIAPEGYYRGVFQTREYTLREWSRYFDILEYVERGMGHFQDLVVMRRPA